MGFINLCAVWGSEDMPPITGTIKNNGGGTDTGHPFRGFAIDRTLVLPQLGVISVLVSEFENEFNLEPVQGLIQHSVDGTNNHTLTVLQTRSNQCK